MSDKTTVAQAIKMISDQDMCHWSDAHDRVTLAALREYDWSTPSAIPVEGAEALARKFHEAYERLAPTFGYLTSPDTRTFDPTSANGRLMIAVCAEVAAIVGTPSKEGAGLTDQQRGSIAYQLTKRLVIDMPTARAVVDAALKTSITSESATEVKAAIGSALDDLWALHGNGFGTPYEKPIATLQTTLDAMEQA